EADFDRLGHGRVRERDDQREDQRNTQAKAAHQILPLATVICGKASTGARGREAIADAAPITAASSRRIESIAKALLAAARASCYPLGMTDAAIQRVAAKARPKAPWQVWRDSAGRLSPLRIAALAFLCVPVAV